MGPTGRLVTIKRSGVDGPHFPLSLSTCLFGRVMMESLAVPPAPKLSEYRERLSSWGIECDIRIQLPVVSKQHCKIEVNGQEAVLFNFSSANPTQVNGSAIEEPVQLKHGDVITIVDRSFRYENESHQDGSKSPGVLGQRCKQESLRRVSRSSLPSDPDGKVQDSIACSKPSEENVSGRPLKKVEAASPISLNAVRPSDLAGGNHRNAPEPTGRDSQDDPSGTFSSCKGDLRSLPSARGLEKGSNSESPFKKLYDSMKEELDVKPEKGDVLQSGRKSGSRSHRVQEKECSGGLQGGTPVPVSPKSRPRSGRSTQVKADAALEEQGISQPEGRREGEEAVETPKEARGPDVPPGETTKSKTLAQRSPQTPSRKRPREDVGVTSGRALVDQKEGFGAENKTLTPRKSLSRNPTPAKVETAGDFGDTPEKLFSRKRKSIPTSVDILTPETETQNHTILAPLPVQVERKIPNSSVHQPEKGGAAVGRVRSGSPGRGSIDPSNPISKTEGTPLKRRRVSFGGRLKPELFDENLPPNTPLKRGETPRRSLVSHTPPVLKKIIKERPQPSGREDSSGLRSEGTAQPLLAGSPARPPAGTPPGARDQRRRSAKPSASSGSRTPRPAEAPRRGGRRSGGSLSKRSSVDRSQHEILQMIFSKRRSGASEANLIVAKSWADVVRLGAKQTQAKAVKHGPQRPLNRRPRKANTPKKPVSGVPSQFSTGHANSPCTIIIGKAHLEKVNVPARPYRMPNFVSHKKMDFSEDLSGLTEMFQTPAAKMKPQTMSLCPSTFSNSEDVVKKEFQVPDSGEKPLPCMSENFGENEFSVIQTAPQEPFDQSLASPVLRRQSIRANVNIEKTPGSEAEAPKVALSANRLRRSLGLRSTQMLGAGLKDEEAKGDTVENASGRRLTKTPRQGQNVEAAAKEQDGYVGAKEQDTEFGETSEAVVAVRRSRRYSEQKQEPVIDLTPLKRLQDTEPREDLGSIQGLLRTPIHAQGPKNAENQTTEKCQKSSKSELVGMPTRMSIQLKAAPQKADLEEEPSALRKPTQVPRESPHSHGKPGGGDEDILLFNRMPEQKLSPAENVPGSKRRPRTPKNNMQSLEDLAGLRELFQTPNHTDKPMTGDQSTKVFCKSPLTGPGKTPASQKRQLKTPPQKADLEEEPSALRKPTQTPGGSSHSHGEPEGEDEDIKLFKETPKQKLDPAANVTGSKRQPRTPKKKVQSLEDLTGLREPFQTPTHTDKPMTGDQTTKVLCKSPLTGPGNTPASKKRWLETPPKKVDLEEESSVLRKPTQVPGESPHSHRDSRGGDKDVKLFNKTPEQKPAENVTGSKRRPGTPKRNVQSLPDMLGLKEVFQTPDPVTGDQTTKVPCKSPLAEPVSTPTNRNRRFKIPQKVDLAEESSAPRKSTQTPVESQHSHGEPGGGDEDIKLFNKTPEQKMNPVVTGSKRKQRTPRKSVQSLEDLARLRELFQTPDHTDKLMTDDKTTKAPCKSPLAELVNMPTSRRRLSKTPSQKVNLEEESSALTESTMMPAESPHGHREPIGGDEGIRLLKETPKQNLDPAETVTGSKRRPRTPKRKVQSLEDLAGLKELFKTPDSVTGDHTTKVSCKSPLAEPVNTPTSKKRHLKTPPQKVDLEEKSLALRKPTQTPGGSPHSHRQPVGEDEDIKLFKETPKQKLDPAENVTGSKRRPRTPKEKVHSLEDLAGLRELFQSPDHTDKPMTGDQTTKTPCKSPLAKPVNTPASRKRHLETPPQKVDLEEESSTLRKPTQTPGENTHLHREPVDEDEDIETFKKIPEQKLDPAENVTSSKKKLRTVKEKVQFLEDMVGFKELFQTPEQTKKTTAVVKTAILPCKSPRAQTVNTPTHTETRLKVSLGKVAVEKELSAVTKSTLMPAESPHEHREPVVSDEGIGLLKETPKQKLKPAGNVSGSKRQPRTPKKKVQSLEDLAGLKELFKTPDSVTGDHTTKVSCKSPLAEPVNTPTSKKRHLKTPPQKVDLEEESSALRKPTQTPGENTHLHREPVGEDGDIKLFKETLKQKLDPAENVTGSKRQARTPKKKVQSLEDLVGLRELFQSPDHTDKPVIGDQTTKAPRKSPLTGPGNKPTNRRRRLKTPLQKVDLEEVSSALRKPTQMPGGNTHSHREPVDGDEDIRLFKETTEEKLEPVGNVTRSKRWPRTPRKTVQSLEDPVGLKKLIPTPNHTDKPMTDVTVTKASCKSPLTGPGNEPTNRRRLRTRPQKVDLEEEPSALGKRPQTPEETTNSLRESGEDKDPKLFKRTAKQKLGPTENVVGRKYRLRAPKEKAQTLEDVASSKEPGPTPDHTKKLGGNAGGIKGAPKQIPEGGKPVETLPRVLRASRAKPMEDQAGLGDPIKPQSESSISLSPKRKQGNKGGDAGTKRLRSVSPVQATAEEKPPQKRRRGAPSEGCDPPGPQPMKKKLRIVADGMELQENLTTSKRETRRKGRDAGRTTPPQQGMSLRSRRPKKPELEEPRPEPVEAAVEKVETKRNDRKPLPSSQETKPQSPGDGAKNPAPQGRVRASRMCLRSARPKEMPLPDGAEEKQRQKGVAVHGKSQGEERMQRSDFPSLRSRKLTVPPGGNASESESQQRVTRSAKRCAENIKKDDDIVSIKKIRTRSRRDNEDI